MYLWLLFGFLSILINCDIQRLIKNNPIITHLVGLIAFFFLFTLIDANNKSDLVSTWIKTIYIYILFMLMIKSKWYFITPVLILLLIDQSIKKHLKYISGNSANKLNIQKQEKLFVEISKYINMSIIIIIILGAIHYVYLQKIEYKSNFSFYKFLFSYGTCKNYAPDYNKIK
jgi:hypothetical protein